MRRAARNGDEKRILLVLLLRLVSDFRKILEPLRVTPSQAGVLLFLRHHADARVTDTATALGVSLATLSRTVTALVRKRWVTKRHSVKDNRVVSLSLSRRGNALARQIEKRMHQVSATLAERDRKALGMISKGRRV
jgi:DNA-binding MarR family transcriptional regulator